MTTLPNVPTVDEHRAANVDLWTRYNDLQAEIKQSCLDLIKAVVLDTYPDAVRVEVVYDGDADGAWLSLTGVQTVPTVTLDTEDLDVASPDLLEELETLVRDLMDHWVETDRMGNGFIWLQFDPPTSYYEPVHPFVANPDGPHGPDRCAWDGLPAENARHREA